MYVEITFDAAVDGYDIAFVMRGKDDWWQGKSIMSLMKTMIPASDRLYDPDTKTWSITKAHIAWFEALLEAMHVKVYHKQKVDYSNFHYNQAPVAPSKQSIAAQLAILLCLGDDITCYEFDDLKKQYRRKALELHPDRNNGDGAAMSELNSVWSAYNAN